MASTPSAAVSQRSHDVVIRSSEKLELAPKKEDEWYEQGAWPLVGATLAIVLTNVVSVTVVFLQAQRALNATLRQRRIEALGASLSQFYDPLNALLETNAAIFSHAGPATFPVDDIGREAAAAVWNEVRKRVLANNAEIETILRTKSHLIGEGDHFESYKPLLIHLAMYETFQSTQTEIYRRFMFPNGINGHVAAARLRVLEAYHRSTGEQI